MRILVVLFISVLLSGCRVTGPVNLTLGEAAKEYGVEKEYQLYQSTFNSPIVQPAPERPKPPVR